MIQVMRNTQRTPDLFAELDFVLRQFHSKSQNFLEKTPSTAHTRHCLEGMRQLTTAGPLGNRTLFVHKCWCNRKKCWKAAWWIVYSMPINILRKTKKTNWCMHVINAVCLRFLARPGRQSSADHTCRKTNWAHF